MHNFVISAPYMIYMICIIGFYTGLLIFFIDYTLSLKDKHRIQKETIRALLKTNEKLDKKKDIQQKMIDEKIFEIKELNIKLVNQGIFAKENLYLKDVLSEKNKQINILYTKQAHLKAQNTAFYITLYNTLIVTKIKMGEIAYKDFMKEVYFLQKQGFKKLEEIKKNLIKK